MSLGKTMVMKAYALAQLQEYLPLRLICTMSMYVLFICFCSISGCTFVRSKLAEK